MTRKRSLGFAAIALVAAGATAAVCFAEVLGLARATAQETGATARPIELLQGAGPWLTPVPKGPKALRGKVVVVNFWTYSCINSLRALPYLRAWSERYGSKGLEVVGVHAPEFGFEHDPAKVRRATGRLQVRYPNLQDNGYSVWHGFANQGWPGFAFIDATGRMRGYRLGEGNYDEAERLIRELLVEAGQDLSDVPMAPIEGRGIEAAADWADLRSPESYLGYDKAAGFVSPGGIRENGSRHYVPAASLSRKPMGPRRQLEGRRRVRAARRPRRYHPLPLPRARCAPRARRRKPPDALQSDDRRAPARREPRSRRRRGRMGRSHRRPALPARPPARRDRRPDRRDRIRRPGRTRLCLHVRLREQKRWHGPGW
jgi:thiol-disulfide isomerase/thioredoxin